MPDATAPLPALDPGNTPFWTGGSQGKLFICRCGSCRRWLHPPVPVCRFCLSTDVTPEQACGRGTVLTHTINRQQWLPSLPLPYVIAVIGLDDDPDLRLTSRLIDVEPERVSIGVRVEVCFEAAGDVWLPLFRPIGDDQ
ncbi:Zn-ribbon domain-containing OB-fold protein [Mycobacterium vicinigordonae]|uniref:Zn-ribbon domain-containing OB-fold protein n=1 Tax=Mycobacterium vicinigordonae TaxID=1719132 RepID=UPI001FE390D1|nr:OB-fold domain-containing protein [Mycobacterium vicinigordonae]